MLTSLVPLFVLGLLILVHEFGHFLVARWSGVRVLRFSIGFGKRLVTWTRGETEYSVSVIPLGGYVKMAGEQRGEERAQPWEYLSKPVGTRALIVAAGPLVNYLVALLSLWVVYVIGYPQLIPAVGKVMPETPAQVAGIRVGDRIQQVAGRTINTWDEMTAIIYNSPAQPLEFVIERQGTPLPLTITPKAKATIDPFGRKKTIGLIGIVPSGEFRPYRVNPIAAIGKTIRQQNEWVAQTFIAFWSMFTGRLSMKESVAGPIGIFMMTREAASMGLAPVLFLMSLLSLSLAIFNLFPIPILDGGHLLFLALEKLRGRPVSFTIQERSAQVSFVLLMTLVLIICVNDVSRFGLVEKLMGWIRR